MRRNEHSKNIVLTFLFPFVGLISSLANWRQSWAKNVFWLACVYLGAVFIYCPEGTIIGQGIDGGRAVLELMDAYQNQASLSSLYIASKIIGGGLDIYKTLVIFVVSRFTSNGHVLFALLATNTLFLDLPHYTD